MRTATEGSIHTSAYRIAEFVFEPDFLQNHDTANKIGLPTYIQNGGAKNETTAMAGSNPGGKDHDFNDCQAALLEICPHSKGASFDCMHCMDANRDAVVQKCGNYTDQNSVHVYGGWAVHYYCGIGWPESTFQQSPLSEYCVEHLPAPQTDLIPGGDGYAQYVSCNSNEVDGMLYPVGNSPRAPQVMRIGRDRTRCV
jgi:hypothetical protein